MRMRLMAPLALMVLAPALALALAGGRPASETCVNAGFRMGSAAFDTCVARVGGDDPLAALEGGELAARADKDGKAPKAGEASPLAAMTPTRQTVPGMVLPRPDAREELPASYNAPAVYGMPAPPPPPSWPGGGGNGGGGGSPTPSTGMWPTPPTAPTLPSVVAPNVPAWNFGNQ